jgi:hypothetical protein
MSDLLTCSECGTDLPARVYEAGEILLGENTLRPDNLVKAISSALAAEDSWLKASPSSPRRSNDSIGIFALIDWLGGPDGGDLITAYQHYHGGECEKVANERLAASAEAQP